MYISNKIIIFKNYSLTSRDIKLSNLFLPDSDSVISCQTFADRMHRHFSSIFDILSYIVNPGGTANLLTDDFIYEGLN